MDEKEKEQLPPFWREFIEGLEKTNEELRKAFDDLNTSLQKAGERNWKTAASLKESAERLNIQVQQKDTERTTCSSCHEKMPFLINGICHVCKNYLEMIRISEIP
ncbi:MAG: hypothetical protein ACFFCZ_12365 [Promethearchaeota archaeon]